MTPPNEVRQKFDSIRARLEKRIAGERLDFWYKTVNSKQNPMGPYPFQVDFHNAGEIYKERAMMAGNRCGKTRSNAAETSFPLTGLYPEWWEGKRFDGPTNIWVGSETNEASRDIVQKALLGGLGDQLGTGMIPARCLAGSKAKMRQCGVNDVVDQIEVLHVSGKKSLLGFKTYDQGRKRWQGTSKDVIWFDEEPPEDVYAEGQMRTLDKGGITMLSFTPLKGVGNVVYKFLNCADLDGVYMVNATWDDAPHLSKKDKAQMLASLPEHERDARSKGIPTMGQGVVFPFPDEDLMVDAFDIPKHYKRICGIDFGINHPAAAVWLAIDPDNGTIYVTDCYKQAGEGSPYHASRINAHKDSNWIPVAWPHDGMNREKSGGKTLADHYRKDGVNMMALSARDDDDRGGSQPIGPMIDKMYGLMSTGQFKVFSHLTQWFEEKRMYHRDERLKIVDVRDDIMSATRYGVMMIRYAISSVQADLLHSPLTQTADAEYDPTGSYD